MDFIFDNLQIVLVIAFIVLPIIFNRKRIKKKQAPPTMTAAPTGSEKKPAGERLEDKVRKFFEDMVEKEAAPRPVARAPMEGRAEPRGPMAAPVPEPVPDVMPEPIPPPIGPEPVARHMPHENLPSESGHSPHEWLPSGSGHTPHEQLPSEHGPPPHEMLPSELRQALDRSARGRVPPEGDVWDQATVQPRPGALTARAFQGMSLQDLRKAIVLKEILDVPVALKGPPGPPSAYP
jgi:hypothetical protein